ncbi:hypothetical protein EW146_g715 [Bondarzewia mesenterica]|uniref:Autophagy-related protein 2 n=1 Tax=Bondarzewia mesenterica TaxID=1095465 RepID=A0A4S4M8A8_9AGAM|nr:hypothetical protein EW146_g715 [Bondarzewia mesenterica]
MAWWTPSWLSLPSIDFSLPSGIQRRFISFVLKRSLGHLLKPGQLDIQQIDSQIGSGYVQVRDLELDYNAINSHLAGLPIQLHDGSISSVTARIPWPNPLTANVGLSIESLHLTFHLDPKPAIDPTKVSANLAESVVSVAESFIHHELTPGEEATLRETFSPDLDSSIISTRDNVPGGLDPFINADEDISPDMDPAGVSIFATMIERLLSRFEFDARDTSITLVHPGYSSFSFKVSEIAYGKELAVDMATPNAGARTDEVQGETRAISISGAVLSYCDLRPAEHARRYFSSTPTTVSDETPVHDEPPNIFHLSQRSHSPMNPFTSSPTGSSYAESDSDIDEETQAMMSQSITTLPPLPPAAARPISPASTIASTMFQSAISTIPEEQGSDTEADTGPHNRTPSPKPVGDSEAVVRVSSPARSLPPYPKIDLADSEVAEVLEETVVSFASEPIVIRLTTSLLVRDPPAPSPATSSPGAGPSNLSKPTESKSKNAGHLNISVTTGVIACALRASQLRGILDIASALDSHVSGQTPSPTKKSDTKVSSNPEVSAPTSSMLDQMDATLQIRGIVLLLLPSVSATAGASIEPLKRRTRREVIAAMDAGDDCCISISLYFYLTNCCSAGEAFYRWSLFQGPVPVGYKELNHFVDCYHYKPDCRRLVHLRIPTSDPSSTSSSTPQEYVVVPILITDPHLPTQYITEHQSPPGIIPLDHDHPQQSKQPPSLPTFDVSDWTSPLHRTNHAKLSLWRLKHSRDRRSDRMSAGSVHHLSSSPGKSPPSGGFMHEFAMEPKAHEPAIAVKVTFASSTVYGGSERGMGQSDGVTVNVDFSPLHFFFDLGLTLGSGDHKRASETLMFVDELLGQTGSSQAGAEPVSRQRQGDSDEDEEESDEDMNPTPPASPRSQRAFRLREQERERENERKRLERLVLEDLDLSMDYRQKEPVIKSPPSATVLRGKRKAKSRAHQDNKIRIAVRFPMVRMEVRCPPPLSRSPRSGAFILDIHGITLSTLPLTSVSQPSARFAGINVTASPPPTNRSKANTTLLLAAEWRRVVMASSLVGEEKARVFLSLGSLSASPEPVEDDQHSRSRSPGLVSRPASLTVVRTRPSTRPSGGSRETGALVVSADIPSVHINLSKPVLDGLQLWADDVQQITEQSMAAFSGDNDTEKASSQNPSLIGSKFFVNPTRGSKDSASNLSIGVGENNTPNSETILKAAVSDVFVRLMVPREEADGKLGPAQPFDILASDVDALIELKPEGKDETVVTLSVMDVNIMDRHSSPSTPFLSLVTPRSLVSSPRPLAKIRFTSLVAPESIAKESRVRLTLCGFLYNLVPDFQWIADLARFAKSPPGAFESVVPSERTRVFVKIMDGSVRLLAPKHPGALALHIGELEFSTDLVGDSTETSLNLSVPALGVLLTDDHRAAEEEISSQNLMGTKGIRFWKRSGYALLAEIADLSLFVKLVNGEPSSSEVSVNGVDLRLHMCADTMTALGAFGSDFGTAFSKQSDEPPLPPPVREPTNISTQTYSHRALMASIDEQAFHRLPEVGAAPDMINDDLPSNLEYLDSSFGAAAGLREFADEDLEDFSEGDVLPDSSAAMSGGQGLISKVGGETIRLLRPEGIRIVENYLDTLPAVSEEAPQLGEVKDRIRIHRAGVTLFLYDGYDWASTRRTIENEIKEMKRRLAKIRQLVASGQTYDPNVDETSTLLFNSVYVGLEQDLDELEPAALIAAIDEELKEDVETATQSSWQSLRPQSHGKAAPKPTRISGQRLTRARGPSIEFRLLGLDAEVDQYRPDEELVSRIFATIKDVEIFDHVKTSTWRKFLSALHSDSRGNIRETGSNMVRIELRTVRPVQGNPSEEARLRAKLLPLRLHVDQDALDFLKKFFSFKDSNAPSPSGSPNNEIYFQQAEVFPVGLKLDYKPRRVDYRALREGRTIELMNFFHFDGAEMTLRHITLSGITGWPRFFDMLNDLWTPDVKATQLADVISGVSPIRSVVNVGSGVADLVLLPIAQYRKDGRVVRGVQKGTKAFVQTTAMEAVKLGARLATGTQVILEQAENVLGSQFNESVTAEAVPVCPLDRDDEEAGQEWADGETADLISKYAEQPIDVKEGIQSAYTSLRRNLNSAAQTILAVPMEVYERSGNEGPVRAVIRAVPIAVLKPMIGASEAVSKALLGLHNSMDPNVRIENEAKYKHR